MIRSLILILAIGATSIHFTELDHDSAFFSVLLPLLALLSLLALALWLVTWFHRRGIRQTTNPETGSVDFPGDGSSGGDGG